MFSAIDHVGIAVADLDLAVELYSQQLEMKFTHREVVKAQGVEAVLLDIGDSHIELLAPLAEDTPVGKFLAKKGPGLHHVAYRVSDIDSELERLKGLDFKLIDQVPRQGIRGSRVAFIHPQATTGVLTEIVEPAGGH